MAVKRGTDKGICIECHHPKNDLYHGRCHECRRLFGKANRMGARDEYQRQLAEAELAPKPKPSKIEVDKRDYKLEAWKWKRSLQTLLNVLAEHGFSEDDIIRRYHQNGKADEPDHSISILRKVVKYDDHKYPQ